MVRPPAGDFDYDALGLGYAQQRRADPRIAALIGGALGDAASVLNVGAGAGSYEPEDRHVVAVEPSAAMRAQRPPHLTPSVCAVAERLPFDDGAFDAVREHRENRIVLEHGQPIRFGEQGERGVVQRADGTCELVEVAAVGEAALLHHDEHAVEPALAFALSRLAHTPHGPTPIGVFRDVDRPVYNALMDEQLAAAAAQRGAGDLGELLHRGDTWTIA